MKPGGLRPFLGSSLVMLALGVGLWIGTHRGYPRPERVSVGLDDGNYDRALGLEAQVASLHQKIAAVEQRLDETRWSQPPPVVTPGAGPSMNPALRETSALRSVAPAEAPTSPTAANGDRLYSEEKRWEPFRPESMAFDFNQDGEVGPHELERGRELRGRAAQFALLRSSDGSYPILSEDFRGSRRTFSAMDEDGDGALSEREAIRYFLSSVLELRRFDQDYDGALTPEELGVLPTRFEFLDMNGDGSIHAWEISFLRAQGRW